jgi:hypothetical protein
MSSRTRSRNARRQQKPVFGVEQEQQPIQQHQRGFAQLVEILVGQPFSLQPAAAEALFACLDVAARQGFGQARKDLAEDTCTKVPGDAFFVKPRLAARIGMEASVGAVPRLAKERGPVEEKEEQLQRMAGFGVVEAPLATGHSERGCHVDFEELLGTRARVLPIQTPNRAVAEDAPLHRPVRDHVHAAQVAQHLR